VSDAETSTIAILVGISTTSDPGGTYAIVLLGGSGDISVFAGIGTELHVDFILDIVGYFAP